MNTEFANVLDGAVQILGASNGEDDYILWQKSEDEPNQIHFEFDSQINSGYNNIEECLIDNDGCHILLSNSQLVHFYWQPPRHKELELFITDLKELYFNKELEIDDQR
jgi:hypothetical protein